MNGQYDQTEGPAPRNSRPRWWGDDKRMGHGGDLVLGLRAAIERLQEWPEVRMIGAGEIRSADVSNSGLRLTVRFYERYVGLKLAAHSNWAVQRVTIMSGDIEALIARIGREFEACGCSRCNEPH